MSVLECESRFTAIYGKFVCLEVGKLVTYLNKRKVFEVSSNGRSISLTSIFKKSCKKWIQKVSVVSNDDTQLPSPAFQSKRSVSLPSETSAGLQTCEWVTECKSDSAFSQDCSFENDFLLHFSGANSDFAFVLVCSKLPFAVGNVAKGVANIPWLRVYDFDENSRKNGLLLIVENLIKKQRYFTISTPNLQLASDRDYNQSLSEQATDWFFPKGFSDKPKTLFSCSPYIWHCRSKTVFEQQGVDIANYCSCLYVPVILILWYDYAPDDIICLDFFLSSLLLPFQSENALGYKILLCLDSIPDKTSPLYPLISKYQLRQYVMPLEKVCDLLSKATIRPAEQISRVKLPKAISDDDNSGCVEISEELTWIQQYIEVLPLKSLKDSESEKNGEIGKEFLKGDVVTWIDLAHGKAVERDKLQTVLRILANDIKSDTKKIVLYKILHAPGGGGTTFARQLLWYLHTEVPCGVVVPHPTFSVSQLLESVNLLYEKTQLPVVLLVDGRSDYEVEQLYKQCKAAIVVLHVQRCNFEFPNSTEPELAFSIEDYLPGHVTNNEANKLVDLFSKFAPQSRSALELLASDQSERKHIFEFGLTAFNLQFKGVHTYVKGYLGLNTKGFNVLSNLHPWQKVVAYLSLVQFYGQGGLPKKVFQHVLKGDAYGSSSLYDLGYSGRQLVVENNKEWKINYYAVAKEILNQILSGLFSKFSESKLSKAARVNLHELVFDFIHMLKEAMGNNVSESILLQLSNVILRRDYREMDVDDVYEKRRPFSRLLEDVVEDENRIKVLKALTSAFPLYCEFHAHLGRMLNIMGWYDEAEVSLQKALDLRKKEREVKGVTWSDNVRGRFHHMFGFACRRRANHELSNSQKKGTKPNLPVIFKIIKKAVYHFTEGRKYVTYNRSYGYIGEVRVRLLIAEYVQNNHKEYPDGCVEAFNGVLDEKDIQLSEFIRDTHPVCDQLLAECHRYSYETELKDVKDFYPCMDKFIKCFQGVMGSQKVWQESKSNIAIRRSKIASLKMQYFCKGAKRIPNVDDIENVEDVKSLISNHEETLREVLSSTNYQTVSISYDALEWLEAIRHRSIKNNYSLINVLQTVEAWEKRNEVGYSTFYLYVLHFLLALYSPGIKTSSHYYSKAVDSRRKLKSSKQRFVNTRLTREWLADHDAPTIRKLVCRNKLGVWDRDARFWKDSEAISQLEVCTGIVVQSFYKRHGVIKLDVANPYIQVEIVFYPAYYNLFGSRYSHQSTPVEFFIGFSAELGAEAFSVKALQQNFCAHCKSLSNTITLNQPEGGVCSKCTIPLEMN